MGTPEEQLRRARRALRAAVGLRELDLHEDAVSRAYYAVFHAACALAASIGRDARTHDGLRALVFEHFVKPGTLARRHARLLARSASDRVDADYNVKVDFDAADSEGSVSDARDFLAAVEAILGAANERA